MPLWISQCSLLHIIQGAFTTQPKTATQLTNECAHNWQDVTGTAHINALAQAFVLLIKSDDSRFWIFSGFFAESSPDSVPGPQTTTKQAATLKTIILNNWISTDMRGMRSYVSSYTLRSNNAELFTIHLNRQQGFYQISEFLSPTYPRQNFIIEQINSGGAPKIAAFDKESGNMLGALMGNTLVDANDAPIFHVKPMLALSADLGYPLDQVNPDDFAGVTHEQNKIAAIFSRLPRHDNQDGIVARVRSWAQRFSNAPLDVFEVQIKEEVCDERLFCAVAVIMHNRGGLHLK